ncbi:MAG: CBS domain-containing protein [Gammaproteobacteria bacterium]|jgi:CBS domain-containing protein|nr:CBS domain-containing protein [Gammaproteobacteria bacterium]
MMTSVRIKDYMVSQPVTVLQSATIAEAARSIIEEKVSGVVVVNEAGVVVGMLSELDCLRNLLSEAYNGQAIGGEAVALAMTTPVTTCAADADIISIAESMLSTKQRRRPVVDQGKLLGQITCRQLLGALLDFGS